MTTERLTNLLSSGHYAPQAPTLESLTQSNQYLGALIQFVTSTLEMHSIEDIAWFLTERVIGQLGFEDCIVYLYDENTGKLVQTAAYGDKNPNGKIILDPILLDIGEGIVGRCAASKTTVLVDDLSGESDYIVDDKQRQSELAVPILFEGQLVGVIDSEHSQQGFYTPHHVSTLQAIASVIASKYASLQNVRKLETTIHALEDVKRLQKALFDITELVHLSADLNDFYIKLHHILSDLIPSDSMYIVQSDDNGEHFICPYSYAPDAGHTFEHCIAEQTLTQRLAQTVFAEQHPQLYDVETLGQLADRWGISGNSALPYAWMGVPLMIDNQIRGVVVVQNTRRRAPFSEKSQEALCYVAQKISIAIKRKNDETLLQHLALHDELTGLPNRALFIDRLSHALEKDARRAQKLTCILFLDLDRFKLVNDTYGHHVGDKLLKSVGETVKQCLRKEDTLARFGGDEFAILLEDVEDMSGAAQLSTRIIEALGGSLPAGEYRVPASTSIGIVHANEFVTDTLLPSDMLRCADDAMYQAKQQGKGCFVFHHQITDQHVKDTLIIEQELAEAIKADQFECYLQPIVNLDTQAVVGFETLIRWAHPSKGVVSPADFIEIAEKSGQIIDIDRFMLVKACELLASWLPSMQPLPYLNINLSSNSIAAEDFLNFFTATLKKHRIPPGALNIEITERALINHLGKANFILHEVKKTGQRVILDDFGTGYSSLSYLHQLPIDVVKIDRSFVSTLEQSETSQSITTAIISLANSLNMEVVVEGIEDTVQRDIVLALGARYGQGFLFHKPMDIPSAVKLLARYTTKST
ncbi:EAL domain-containing protein [Aestuariibacter halophilus]|uniref:EAL domain-containing protein n=1 Tax=Fluctibacter halophilus TaxID=226011 RepID=A0ABS8G6F4_9ALTE|nr:EAL domain-containing protein [Aestuariibacter halophilus]MCC2616130.1 EAL domain-containing protein [Aestuariibacter halophilus]